jgi:hypothetical protein
MGLNDIRVGTTRQWLPKTVKADGAIVLRGQKFMKSSGFRMEIKQQA